MTEIPPTTRTALTELLIRELRAAFDAALAAGVPRDDLVGQFQERQAALREPSGYRRRTAG
jgi:hypothetical protein